VVVASLSLHYFTWTATRKTVNELLRVFDRRGLLICRLNSVDDHNYGSSGYPEIERNLYDVRGTPQRSFSRGDIHDLFRDSWQLVNIEQKSIDRYEKEKVVWEFGASKS